MPVGNLVIWDISLQDGSEIYLPPERVTEYTIKWGLEVAPLFHYGPITLRELESKTKEWLGRESFLGNTNIEGFVIKNNKKVDGFGKRMAAKIVGDSFKEQNNENWKSQQTGSVIERIIASFRKEQIWEKAIQHAKEDGLLLNEPKDIGYLIGSVKKDFGIEHGEAIKKRIFKEFYSDIERGIMHGFPEFYKQRLLNQAFEGPVEVGDEKRT